MIEIYQKQDFNCTKSNTNDYPRFGSSNQYLKIRSFLYLITMSNENFLILQIPVNISQIAFIFLKKMQMEIYEGINSHLIMNLFFSPNNKFH